MEDSSGHPVEALDDATNPKLADMLDDLKKLNESESRDCDCGWRKAYNMLHESILLIHKENERLSDYAHNTWIKTKIGGIDSWGKSMEYQFRVYRDEMMNEMMVYRNELRQKTVEPSAVLPRIKNRRYRNGR